MKSFKDLISEISNNDGDNDNNDLPSGAKPISIRHEFGPGHIEDLLETAEKEVTGKFRQIRFFEKPSYWEDIVGSRFDRENQSAPINKYQITEKVFSTFMKKAKTEGIKIPSYAAYDIYPIELEYEDENNFNLFLGLDARQHEKFAMKGPLDSWDVKPTEITFILEFDDVKFLCDRSGADSYCRNWLYIIPSHLKPVK